MNILSSGELMNSELASSARASEAAVIAKLSKDVSVEPVAYSFQLVASIDDGVYGGWGNPSLSFNKPIVPADSIRNLTELYTADAIAAARVAENERCAKVVWSEEEAQRIRALIGKEST